MNPSWSGWSLPSCSRPSTVVISWPLACTANMVQDFTGRPSRSTVHAPQCVVSQPMWVPVSRKTSRIRWTRSSRGSTSEESFSPLIVTWTFMASLASAGALDRLPQRAGRQDPDDVLLVFDRAAQIGLGPGRVGGQLRGLLDRGLVRPLTPERGL